ncbi:hypothetical protein FE257_006673 [Aspergillus nanangensis]|uniref:Tyrosinase copper-binding domain-containing protein n=1 Tax=Aspergillus nanangensis TaxID=2582783 RepID=A0AAD4GVZ6_ASPNN|nr:hypothetical protein FE257_006673 [Aspergillus nanangensis]
MVYISCFSAARIRNMRLGDLILALGVFGLVEGAARKCRNPPQRKEWRELHLAERKEYIDAVHCLANLDSISGFDGAVNRFDDFQATHSDQTPNIHWVGHFVLWHRYYIATYEKALREECGYKGAQPYWNWSLDASSDNSSTAIYETEVFDAEVGFGGNGDYMSATPEQNPLNLTGHTGGGCVKDGPFSSKYFQVNYPEPDCLRRDFIPWIMNTFAQQSIVDHVQSQPDYTTFARALENVPVFSQPNIHGSGHFGVGGVLGQLGNQAQSPADPLFYLHHGNVDRVFWEWQQKDLWTRLHQVGGPVAPMDYSGTNVTLDFTVNIGKLAPDATLEQLLNTRGDVLCYTY